MPFEGCKQHSFASLLQREICWILVSWVHGAGGVESRASVPQGPRMPSALGEDHCVTWRNVWFHPIPPAHVGMEKGEPGDECRIRPFAFRPAWITYIHLCVHKYSPYLQFKELSLLLFTLACARNLHFPPHLSEGCNIKQKLNVSYSLKYVLKTSFFFFLFTTFIPCVLSIIPLYRQNFYFPVASALALLPTDPTEKEINFLLFQLRWQSATPRQMRGDRRIAHMSVGCGGLAQQGVKSSLGDRELHENKDSIFIPGTWAQLGRLGSYKQTS